MKLAIDISSTALHLPVEPEAKPEVTLDAHSRPEVSPQAEPVAQEEVAGSGPAAAPARRRPPRCLSSAAGDALPTSQPKLEGLVPFGPLPRCQPCLLPLLGT